MSRLDAETKRKLREMGVTSLVDAIDIQDDALTLGMVFEERISSPSTTPTPRSPTPKSKASSAAPGSATRTRTSAASTCSNNAGSTEA